jgi:molecular chaperone GrpE (heat shock protein)
MITNSNKELAGLAKIIRDECEQITLNASGRYIKGGEGSHWEGCEETHSDCKIAKLEKENEQLRIKLKNVKEAVQNYNKKSNHLYAFRDLHYSLHLALGMAYDSGGEQWLR